MHRQARRTTAAIASTVALFILPACDGEDAGAMTSQEQETTTSSEPEVPAPTPGGPRVPAPEVEAGSFHGPAVDAYGDNLVQAAYAESVQFAADNTFDERLLAFSPGLTPDDYRRPTERMTGPAAQAWLDTVQRALGGDDEAGWNVFDLTFQFAFADGDGLRADGPLVIDYVIENPTVALAPDGERLEISFDERADLRTVYGGVPALKPVTKRVTAVLVPSPAGSPYHWQVDEYSAETTLAEPVTDIGG
jgi:hypothetical protein